ncbi:biotin--[acetyl-CoA-carboxylase] ligase [Propionibacteriaceae bacterium Y2011]|uniref:biotin--[acetyl-CoA-carboxylase] ligase n=1 Tax=Microlunatus sp. Y2014 TaxID=3418488 RepID=UPI003B478BAD
MPSPEEARPYDPGVTGDVPVVDRDRLAAVLLAEGADAGRGPKVFAGVNAVAETGSTNADLAAVARTVTPGGDERPGPRLLVADHQTAGRGRRGRGWSADPGTSQAISVLWWPTRTDRWSWLPLLTGLAVCDAVRAVGVPAGLKWPNDVVVPDSDGTTGKLAGLLAERAETPAGPACVLGIGLNTTADRDQLPVPTATSLALAGAAPFDVTAVVIDLVSRLVGLLQAWQSGTADHLLAERYADRSSTLGRRVRADLGTERIEGEAVRIDADGGLVLQVGGRERTVVAGDVVHLRW